MILEIRYTFYDDQALATSDPILLFGEPGTNGKIMKIGDGMSTWSQLPSLSIPNKGDIPSNVSFQYVESRYDPLCGNKYDLPRNI